MSEIPEKLTDKQQLFVTEYLACGMNATVAAKRAGYSEKTAYSQGQRLLKNAEIRAAVDAHLAQSAMSAGEVLARLTDLASASLGDLIAVADDGTISYDFKRLEAAGKLGLIKEIGYSQRGQMIVKLHDPLVALEKLARYHRLLGTAPVAESGADALTTLRNLIVPTSP